jgi:hypothetical protein
MNLLDVSLMKSGAHFVALGWDCDSMACLLDENGAGLVLAMMLTGKIANGPSRGLLAFSMALSSGITMVLARAGTPVNRAISAARLLHLMSAKGLHKMSRIAMLVDAAGEETWVFFDVEKEGDLGKKPVKNP